MTTRNIRWSLMTLGACAALMSTSAHAVWTFGQSNVTNLSNYVSCTPNVNGCPASGTTAATIDTTKVSLSGFAVTNGTGNAGFASGATWASAPMIAYSGGQGVNSDGSAEPNHAVDNNGKTEGVLLSFTASTVLNSIGLGYTSNGTTAGVTVDLSLFRWSGNQAPGTAISPAGAAGALGGSWELVGNYGDMAVDTSNPYNVVNTSGKTSSWWLISAYNSGFGSTTSDRGRLGNGLDNGNDYFKLFAVAGTKCTSTIGGNGVCGGTTAKVAEPATLALTSVALLGVAGLRRRKAKMAD